MPRANRAQPLARRKAKPSSSASARVVAIPRAERRKLSREYLLARLQEECNTRGRAVEIAEATGVSPSHISNIRKGRAQLGEAFASALAEFWALDRRQLEDEAAGASEVFEALPNLRAALEFCRGAYPSRFLEEIERQALKHGFDLRRPEWVLWLETHYWDWKEKQRKQRLTRAPERSGTYAWGDDDD